MDDAGFIWTVFSSAIVLPPACYFPITSQWPSASDFLWFSCSGFILSTDCLMSSRDSSLSAPSPTAMVVRESTDIKPVFRSSQLPLVESWRELPGAWSWSPGQKQLLTSWLLPQVSGVYWDQGVFRQCYWSGACSYFYWHLPSEIQAMWKIIPKVISSFKNVSFSLNTYMVFLLHTTLLLLCDWGKKRPLHIMYALICKI